MRGSPAEPAARLSMFCCSAAARRLASASPASEKRSFLHGRRARLGVHADAMVHNVEPHAAFVVPARTAAAFLSTRKAPL